MRATSLFYAVFHVGFTNPDPNHLIVLMLVLCYSLSVYGAFTCCGKYKFPSHFWTRVRVRSDLQLGNLEIILRPQFPKNISNVVTEVEG